MLEFQRGDDSAFDRIVIQYRTAVRRFIFRYVQDPERVEDLSQEAFLRVYRARGRYRPSAGFRTWLFTIVTRLCLNEIRSRKRERRVIVPMPGKVGSGEDEEGFLEGVADPKEEPGEVILHKRELAHTIRTAIEELPPSQRAAVLLLRFEELSYREIAEVMGLSVMAVKSLLHRAREGLRGRLARFLEIPTESAPEDRLSSARNAGKSSREKGHGEKNHGEKNRGEKNHGEKNTEDRRHVR